MITTPRLVLRPWRPSDLEGSPLRRHVLYRLARP